MHLHIYIPLHIFSVCVQLFIWSSRHHSLNSYSKVTTCLCTTHNISRIPTLYSLNIPIHSSNIIIFPTLYSTSLNVYILVCSLVLHPRKSKERKRNITPYLHTFYMQYILQTNVIWSALYCVDDEGFMKIATITCDKDFTFYDWPSVLSK